MLEHASSPHAPARDRFMTPTHMPPRAVLDKGSVRRGANVGFAYQWLPIGRLAVMGLLAAGGTF